MATGLSAAERNTSIDASIGRGAWIQLHTGDPGSAGTANVATNSTRKQATFGSASAGAAVTTADLLWSSVPAGETYTHYSRWTASTAGSFLASGTITANAVLTGDDFKIASGNLSASITGA